MHHKDRQNQAATRDTHPVRRCIKTTRATLGSINALPLNMVQSTGIDTLELLRSSVPPAPTAVFPSANTIANARKNGSSIDADGENNIQTLKSQPDRLEVTKTLLGALHGPYDRVPHSQIAPLSRREKMQMQDQDTRQSQPSEGSPHRGTQPLRHGTGRAV